MKIDEVFLYATEDHLRVAPIVTSLENVARVLSNTQHPKHVFFASEYSVVPGRLMSLFHRARTNGRVVGVALDKIGLSVLELWTSVELVDAQTSSIESTISKIRAYLCEQCEAEFDLPEVKVTELFISYSSRDAQFKDKLTERLMRWRWSWWEFADSERDYQQGISREIADRICKSAAIIFLLTRNWTSSKWCVREYDFAVHREIDAFCLLVEQTNLEIIQNNLITPDRPFIDFTLSSDVGFQHLGQALDRIRSP
jgi:hypothetical protein